MDGSDRVTNLTNFNPFGRPFLDDPRAFYTALTQASPGFAELEGVPSAYVGRHAHVTEVLKDPTRFSSLKPKGLPGMERVDFFNGLPVMNYSDDPMHERLRRIVQPAFSPRRAMRMSDAAATIIEDLLDRLEGRAEFEVMNELMRPFSNELLLGRFMGVPEADHSVFLDYLGTIPLLQHVPPGGAKPQAYLDAWQRGVEYCARSAERARRNPGDDDLISVLVSAHAEDGKLSDDELMAMMVVLFIGGISTVAGTLGSALLNLARFPDAAARIRDQPALALKLFEESLRIDPAVLLVMRFATSDTEFDGKIIRKGMPVYTLISAACNDPAVFPHPERVDLDRPNLIEHLGFGRGIHTCIGSSITRGAAPLVINAMACRFPQLHVASPGRIGYAAIPRSRHLASAVLATA